MGRQHEMRARHDQILSENSWRMTSINDDRVCRVGIFGVGSLIGEMREVKI
jgi:hypothetical protein